jgi:asparagine synthase (glutamine-hydrolysing)
MSGLLIGWEPDLHRDWAKKLAFTASTGSTPLDWEALSGTITRVDDLALWGPASDPLSGVSVALGGRVAFDEAIWQKAGNLPYKGGLACRLILEKWLSSPEQITDYLNGAFCVLIRDPREHQTHLFTDRLGIYPVYIDTSRKRRICSHPDVLADWTAKAGDPKELDLASMAEQLSFGTSSQPYSYYLGIEQLDPACHYRFSDDEADYSVTTYWQPELADISNRVYSDTLEDEIAEAMTNATRRRTHRYCGEVGLFLSGGADSRTLLFGANSPSKIHAITFCDEDNLESRIAVQIAKAAGARHSILYRDPEHYGNGAQESVRISGGMWSIKDAHYTGFYPWLEEQHFGTVLTACYADYLLKGLGLNKRQRSLFGIRIPFYDLGSYNKQFYSRIFKLSSEQWQQQVMQRHQARFSKEITDCYQENPYLVEERRIRPLSRAVAAMSHLYLMRTLPWDPVLADNEIADLFIRMPVSAKLNAKAFIQAVAKILGPNRNILYSKYNAPLDASETQTIIRNFGTNVAMKLKKDMNRALNRQQKPSIATRGSWPNFPVYVQNSLVIKSLWEPRYQETTDILTELMGQNPWQSKLHPWHRDFYTGDTSHVERFLRMLTIKLWLDQR